MPISALSEAAARAICSSSVLNDAISVVKELLDNALDSHATVVTIEVSANTLDVIQVKDNGTGVGVQDRQLLCKRGHTSKISTIDDLMNLGGTTLGFRGEALASIAELSSGLTITTRVDGEIVGTALQYDSSLKLKSSASKSHPVGTSVQVRGFLTSIPVRRQVALNNTSRTLIDLKKLLFAYAFARPSVRLSLKILKGKNEKSNWVYVPSTNEEALSEVTTKILGKEVVSFSKQHTVVSECGNYRIMSILLLKGYDLVGCSGIGQYVSVDRRPLNSDRGVIRDMLKQYKKYLQDGSTNHQKRLAKPFICMHLTFPKGSYDINVEPAKDEVLFEDSQILHSLAQKLFNEFYGALEKTPIAEQPATANAPLQQNSAFNILLTRHPKTSDSQENQSGWSVDDRNAIPSFQSLPIYGPQSSDTGNVTERCSTPSSGDVLQSRDREKSFCTNMYDTLDEETEIPNETYKSKEDACPNMEDAEEDILDPKITNPFTIAKLHARTAPRMERVDNILAGDIGPGTPASNSRLRNRASQRQPPMESSLLDASFTSLPTPLKSPGDDSPYQNPGPPVRPWRRHGHDEDSLPGEDDSPPTLRREVTLLDNWARTINITPSETTPGTTRLERIKNLSQPAGNRHVLEDQPTPTRSARISNLKPFKSPFKISSAVSVRRPQAEFAPISGSTAPSLPQIDTDHSDSILHDRTAEGPNTTDLGLPSQHHLELDRIMDFEHRKKAAIIQQRRAGNSTVSLARGDSFTSSRESRSNVPPGIRASRDEIRDRNSPQPTDYSSRFDFNSSQKSSPHRNRYLAATRALDRPQEKQLPKQALSTFTQSDAENCDQSNNLPAAEFIVMANSDPRAYLIRHLKSLDKSTTSTTVSDPNLNDELRAKRVKGARLPFESIPSQYALHNQIATSDSPMCTIPTLHHMIEQLQSADPYIKHGTNEEVQWEDLLTSSDITELGDCVTQLLKREYRARVRSHDGLDVVEGSPQIEIAVARAVEAHLDRNA